MQIRKWVIAAAGVLLLIPLAFAGLITQSGPRHFSAGGGGGTGPTYTPLYTWSAAGGTLGNLASGWVSFEGDGVVYSNAVAGPHGGNRVGLVGLDTGDSFFAGEMVGSLSGLSINSGDHIWIRVYHYFPGGFCFSSDPNHPSAPEGNWGNIKWYRFQFTGGNIRNTIQLGDLAGTAIVDEPTCGSTVGWGGITDEYGGSGENKGYPDDTVAEITRGSWLALQTHIFFQSNSTGYVESWINDTYLGRAEEYNTGNMTFATAPASGSLDFIVLGDYWNGLPGFTQDFYIDEIIITTEQPNTVDGGGRPFIDPDTQVSDFP